MCKEMEKFTALLSPEANEQLNVLRVLHDDITIIRDTDTFIEGFRLGAKPLWEHIRQMIFQRG